MNFNCSLLKLSDLKTIIIMTQNNDTIAIKVLLFNNKVNRSKFIGTYCTVI